MLRVVICGGAGSGKSAIADQLPPIEGKDFTLIDTAGDKHFMAGLVSAARAASFAIVVIDARKGMVDNIYRQCHALTLLGVTDATFCVSKMERVDYSQEIFQDIDDSFRQHAETLGLAIHGGIPVSTADSDAPSWYAGPTLRDHIENLTVERDRDGPFRFRVNEISGQTLGGNAAGGAIAEGDAVVALPSASTGKIKSVARHQDRMKLTVQDRIEVMPGDVICPVDNRTQLSDQFRVNLLWLHEDPLLPSRSYLLKMGLRETPASVTDIRHVVNPHTLEHEAGKIMRLNDAGACNIAVSNVIPYDPFTENRTTGSFTLLDRQSRQRVAFGAIEFGLHRADNIHWQALGIGKLARAEMKQQKPVVLWFTGLSASGKSTIANLVDQRLHLAGRHTYTLDGDNVRHGLNQNLGFTDADRVENIRRIGEVSKLMVDAGLICLASFISPFRAERRMARELVEENEFIEIYVEASLDICEARDPKGLYKKARAGEIRNFTGFDSPYEEPENAEIVIPTEDMNPEQAADHIIAYLRQKGFID